MTTETKSPSAISQARIIFNQELSRRASGAFASNREFRATVLSRVTTELGVSIASASTMYNVAAKEATAANPDVGLGRDPKKVKAKKVKVEQVAETV